MADMKKKATNTGEETEGGWEGVGRNPIHCWCECMQVPRKSKNRTTYDTRHIAEGM
jgi:hypothetical protein